MSLTAVASEDTSRKNSVSKPRSQENGPNVPHKRLGPRPSLTDKQKQDLCLAFGEFDPRGKGMIDSRNFIISLRAMGFEPKIAYATQFIEDVIGPNGKDVLDFKDYYQLMSLSMLGDDSKKEVVKMFKMFCNEQTGVIEKEDLSKIAEELEEDISPDELEEMISFANTSLTGGVTLEEFLKMMERPELE